MNIQGWDAMIALGFNAAIRWCSLQALLSFSFLTHLLLKPNRANCMTYHWFFNSVRVSNELGAGNAKAAKFAVVVVSVTSVAIGVVCMCVVFATRDYFPYLFTNSEAVAEETTQLAVLLGITVLLNSLQPVLSGKNKKAWSCNPTNIDLPHLNLKFSISWYRCCCWSRMAICCCLHQHRVLLYCRIAGWHTPRIHIRFWSWGEKY